MTRARPADGPTISLFPFLAVLLCTMGALLVLLVLFSRSAARSDADAVAGGAEGRVDAEALQLELEQARWRLEQLRQVRDRTAADLSRARMQLAGVESDNRGLADELDELERTSRALDGAVEKADEAELADLERRLAEARDAVEKARRERAARPPAYAVVPYEGANGTHRRPLYIECCIDGVYLQPEGIRLGPGDFEGPPGPGNPLASGLRAAREHLARMPGETGDPAAQPYPLLLVRPSGVMAYYAAREAIQSWGSEFGYQFIDEDWVLTFPPRDPALADAEARAIEEARRRIAWLGETRKSRSARPTKQYRAATTRGGVVAEGGPSVLGDQSRWDWTEEQAEAGKPLRAGDSSGAREGTAGRDGSGAAGGDPILGATGPAVGTGAGPGAGGGTSREVAGGPNRGVEGNGTAEGLAGGRVDSFAGEAGGATGGFGDRYAGPSRFYASQREGSPSGVAAPQTTGGIRGVPGSEAGAGRESAGVGSASATTSAGGGGGPAMPGLAQAGGGAASASADSASSATASLANRRGSNWASLATQERPIPLRRPVRLECSATEFRILDDAGARVESRVPIPGSTADAIDPLVTAVHSKVGRWGIAGDRMYWKPELVLSETPDGRSRREDLERLLVDSGLDTRRVDSGDVPRPLPPVERTGGLFRAR